MEVPPQLLPEYQNLVHVNAYASVVCPYPLKDSWDVVRDWGSFAWLPQLFGCQLDSALQVAFPYLPISLLGNHQSGAGESLYSLFQGLASRDLTLATWVLYLVL